MKLKQEETYYRLLLTLSNGIGPKTFSALLAQFGTAAECLAADVQQILAVPGMSKARYSSMHSDAVKKMADKEWAFAEKNDIQILHTDMEAYPFRLRDCIDAPRVLFFKGHALLNKSKVISIVGTRHLSEYGHRLAETLVKDLQGIEDLMVVSGLAQGIDAVAHRSALKYNVPTVGVLGHGLDRIFPNEHKSLAKEMLAQGGLLTEYVSGTAPEKGNFPMRNRIVAGMSDLLVVVESAQKGGAMITAYLAAGYNREVAAVPGRVGDAKSAGCNELIKRNVASLIQNGEDILTLMNWQGEKKKQAPRQLSIVLSTEAQRIWHALNGKPFLHIDELTAAADLSPTTVAATLLEMEMDGLLHALPGKRYSLA